MRKPNPKNIYLARRAATLSRLTGPGMPPERAEALVAAWEAEAGARGLIRDSAAFWEGSGEWIEKRRRA
jgi:hypothetical protein